MTAPDLHFAEYASLRRTVRTRFGDFDHLDTGSGPPTVFVHGLLVSPYLWRHVIARLRGERRCIAYALPAHGRSRVSPHQDLSLESQAAMLGAFLDALDLASVDLVANDTGGAIAQVFAVRHPERVRTLTLTNCEARDVLPSPSEIARLVNALASKGALAPVTVQLFQDPDQARGGPGLGATLEHPERLSDDDVRALLEHGATLDRAREVERFVLALHADQLVAIQPGLRRLTVPTLVVWGTADPVFELELAYWLRETLPGCREVVEVPGARLFWPVERPDELVLPLRRFLAEPAGARSVA